MVPRAYQKKLAGYAPDMYAMHRSIQFRLLLKNEREVSRNVRSYIHVHLNLQPKVFQ